MFLYTNENYSHINNKIDLDENEILKDTRKFSNYMHEKHMKSLQKFRETDIKLIEELRDVEKLKSLDIEIDGNVYIELLRMIMIPPQQLLEQLSVPQTFHSFELEGIVYCIETDVYDKIHELYLDNLEALAVDMVKDRHVPPKLRRFIRHLKRRQVKLMNLNVMTENPWLFARNSRKEIQNLVFQQHEDIQSPRLHENVLYHNIIMARIEEVLERENPTLIEPSEEISNNNFQSRNTKLMKRGAINDIKIEPEIIPLTDTIEVIPHANEINKQKMIRKPTVMQLREKEEEESDNEQNAENIENSSIPRNDSNPNSNQVILNMFRRNTTQNLVFIERKFDDRGEEVEFDQDFILCTVFGYKNVYIKEEDDIFEIFIPVKRNDYTEQHEFTRNILNGYRSGSEYSQCETSFEESPQIISHRRVSIDTHKFSTIMPRGIIRKKTIKTLNKS